VTLANLTVAEARVRRWSDSTGSPRTIRKLRNAAPNGICNSLSGLVARVIARENDRVGARRDGSAHFGPLAPVAFCARSEHDNDATVLSAEAFRRVASARERIRRVRMI
jgi:hypothetical protein